MKKSVAIKWIKALRSGKYKQGEGVLNCDGKFCCLGVLCEIAPKGTAEKNESEGYASYDGDAETLPDSIIEYAGMVAGNYAGQLPKAYRTPRSFEPQRYLSNLNDAGLSFKQIARIIEKNWKGL